MLRCRFTGNTFPVSFANEHYDEGPNHIHARFRGHKDIFRYWSAQIKAILKAKRVWHLGQADDAGSSSLPQQVWASKEVPDVAGDPEEAMDVAGSIFLRELGEGQHCIRHEDPRLFWKFLHGQ